MTAVLEKKVKTISRKLGVTTEELHERALHYYMTELEQEMDLQRELNGWQQLGGALWQKELPKHARR